MSLRRVGVLLKRELLQGPRSFIFVWAVIAPVIISLVVSVIFGSLFTGKPKLGLVDEGGSQLATIARELDSVITKDYDTVSEMRGAVEAGAVDMGIVIPAGFDSSVAAGEETEIIAYIWGESLAKDRTILKATVVDNVREVAGQETPVAIEAITLGDEESIPWNDRLLPFIVLITVFIGGSFLPAVSVINEKEKKTLDALVVTPTSAEEVFMAKGLLGVILSLLMGIAILVLNQAFGAQPLLLVLVLVLGAIMAAELGLVCGALIKDTTTLFAIWKSAGIVLFAPAFVYLFPQIPEWVAKIFPTYYLIEPIVEISQRGGGWPEIAMETFVLVALDLAMVGLVLLALRRTRERVA